MGGHELFAGCCQLPQKTDTDAGCLFRIVFEAVMPVGMIEPDRENGIAREGQSVVTGCERTTL